MNFMGMGPGELILVLIIAVIVLGPGKLPEVARALGKTMREFRSLTDGFQNELRKELDSTTSQVKKDMKPLRDVANSVATVKNLDPVSALTSSVPETKAVADAVEEVASTVQQADESFVAHYQDAQGAIGTAVSAAAGGPVASEAAGEAAALVQDEQEPVEFEPSAVQPNETNSQN